ncbi:hypothetical protein [Leptospira noguchii]|uniref:hypothetical protein n=1 Tax=Leptospira noguchii TaxID=28182 RepID=UPI001FB663A9|nr:hypothetical protein [Leptospira noguchii]UOG53573.1 hypothetical protein MAL09_05295 [Leptospira noguchii]
MPILREAFAEFPGSCSNSAKHSLWVVFKLSKTLPMGRVLGSKTHIFQVFRQE